MGFPGVLEYFGIEFVWNVSGIKVEFWVAGIPGTELSSRKSFLGFEAFWNLD